MNYSNILTRKEAGNTSTVRSSDLHGCFDESLGAEKELRGPRSGSPRVSEHFITNPQIVGGARTLTLCFGSIPSALAIAASVISGTVYKEYRTATFICNNTQ